MLKLKFKYLFFKHRETDKNINFLPLYSVFRQKALSLLQSVSRVSSPKSFGHLPNLKPKVVALVEHCQHFRVVWDPIVFKSSSLSSDFSKMLVRSRESLVSELQPSELQKHAVLPSLVLTHPFILGSSS